MNYWDQVYKNKKHLSAWPWSGLISLVHQFGHKIINKKKNRVLELGFGAGANIPFFLSQKSNYYGIDASPHIVKKVKKTYKNLSKNIICADFKDSFFDQKNFDLIFDRAAICHNNMENILKTTDIIYKKLRKNGIFIGVDWFSTRCSDFNKNKKDYQYFKKGDFKNIGGVYFSNKIDMNNFFKKFKIIYLEENIKNKFDKNKKNTLSSWSIVVAKN